MSRVLPLQLFFSSAQRCLLASRQDLAGLQNTAYTCGCSWSRTPSSIYHRQPAGCSRGVRDAREMARTYNTHAVHFINTCTTKDLCWFNQQRSAKKHADGDSKASVALTMVWNVGVGWDGSDLQAETPCSEIEGEWPDWFELTESLE